MSFLSVHVSNTIDSDSFPSAATKSCKCTVGVDIPGSITGVRQSFAVRIRWVGWHNFEGRRKEVLDIAQELDATQQVNSPDGIQGNEREPTFEVLVHP